MNFNIDLKNIDLKNISLEDIQAKLKKVEKKTWIKLGSSLGAIIAVSYTHLTLPTNSGV